jgi:uncharacterized protein YndB with AHSA1/START domain
VTAKTPEIVLERSGLGFMIRRSFDAPRELVFDAWTKPEHLKRWMGPRRLVISSYEVDLRVGGGYRFVHRALDGQEFAFHGEYREIVRPERLVTTFVFELMPDHESLQTVTFDESDGRTMITTSTLHAAVEGLDRHLPGGGMEAGMTESYERLDELLVALQRG